MRRPRLLPTAKTLSAIGRAVVMGALVVWVVWVTRSAGRPAVAAGLGLAALGTFVIQRRQPVVTLATVIASLMLATELGDFDGPDDPFLVMLLWASFGVGRYGSLRQQPWAAAATLLFLSMNLLLPDALTPADIVFPALLMAAPWLLGLAVQLARTRARLAEDRADEVIRAQEHLLRQATRDERVRLARELHDVAAHSMSVVSLHAQVLRRKLEAGSPVSAEGARVIETAAQEALWELRRVVGVLRPFEAAQGLEPQPHAGQIPDLVGECRRAGQPVDLVVDGTPPDLAPGVSLTVFRIAQEALSNARRHGAGPAQVALRWSSGGLDLEVSNPVAGRARPARPGHGLIGMRERAELYGGTFTAGADSDGYWRVDVHLPVAPVHESGG